MMQGLFLKTVVVPVRNNGFVIDFKHISMKASVI